MVLILLSTGNDLYKSDVCQQYLPMVLSWHSFLNNSCCNHIHSTTLENENVISFFLFVAKLFLEPTFDFVLFVFSIFNTDHIHRCTIRENNTIGFLKKISHFKLLINFSKQISIYQIFITSVDNTLNNGIIKQWITHPFGNNNINFFDAFWQLNIFDFSFDYANDFVISISANYFLGIFDNIWFFYLKISCSISYGRTSMHFYEHTAMTILAPALAANKLKIPTPQPISKTTLSLNKCRLLMIAFRNVFVRISSLSSSCATRKHKFTWLWAKRIASLSPREQQNGPMNRGNILWKSYLPAPFYPNRLNHSKLLNKCCLYKDIGELLRHRKKNVYTRLHIHGRLSWLKTRDFLS